MKHQRRVARKVEGSVDGTPPLWGRGRHLLVLATVELALMGALGCKSEPVAPPPTLAAPASAAAAAAAPVEPLAALVGDAGAERSENCAAPAAALAAERRAEQEQRAQQVVQAKEQTEMSRAHVLAARVDVVRGAYESCVAAIRARPDPVCAALAAGDPVVCPASDSDRARGCADMVRWSVAMRRGDVDSCDAVAQPDSARLCRAILAAEWDCESFAGPLGLVCAGLRDEVDPVSCPLTGAAPDVAAACAMLRSIRAWKPPGSAAFCRLLDGDLARRDCIAAIGAIGAAGPECAQLDADTRECLEPLLDWTVRSTAGGARLAVRVWNPLENAARCAATLDDGTTVALSAMRPTGDVQVVDGAWPFVVPPDAGAPRVSGLTLACQYPDRDTPRTTE